MRVLVTVASKHGATEEIGAALAHSLARRGHHVVQLPPQDVDAVAPYDAVILGSGVYAGHWLQPAKDFAERLATTLAERPVWIFSSGPLGDPPKPAGDPVDVSHVSELVQPREHVVFAGRLDRAVLGFGERAIVAMVKAPYGDFRDWEVIDAWADVIGSQLAPVDAEVVSADAVPA
ncbi:MAG TPA: flavodoxin domain-containing protein [Candidatus Limnocylindria bacterium]|jgi:menaquinone-dependent protoporphyrinogen oxidase